MCLQCDGQLLATGSYDGYARIWNTEGMRFSLVEWLMSDAVSSVLALGSERRSHPSCSVLSGVYGLILIVMIDWSKRGNINTAAVVTIVQCNTLVV